MANLIDSIVRGALRITGTLFAGKVQTNTFSVPTSDGGTTYGTGSSGQILKKGSNSIYWASDNNTDTKVQQSNTTANSELRILLSGTATDTTETTTSFKSTNFRCIPQTGEMKAVKFAASAGSYMNDQIYAAGDITSNYSQNQADLTFRSFNAIVTYVNELFSTTIPSLQGVNVVSVEKTTASPPSVSQNPNTFLNYTNTTGYGTQTIVLTTSGYDTLGQLRNFSGMITGLAAVTFTSAVTIKWQNGVDISNINGSYTYVYSILTDGANVAYGTLQKFS